MLHVARKFAKLRPVERKRQDIQGLRAVAVVVVVLDHYFDWPTGGFVGVDMFFVISGFLITDLLIREGARSGRVSISAFYRRRIRRILPLALLVILVTLVAGHLLLVAGRNDALRTDSAWALIFGINWHLAAVGTDYFQSSQPPSPLQHYWSLAVEEQFYVVWPVLVVAAVVVSRRLRLSLRQTVATLAVAILVGSFAWATVQSSTSPTFAYFSSATRAWELASGALLAAVIPVVQRLPRIANEILAALGVVGLVSSFVVISQDSTFPAPWGVLPVAATVLLLAAGCSGRVAWASFLLTISPMVVIGSLSYSIYLWHWPVLQLVEASGLGSPAVVALVVTVALSLLSYFLIEAPVLASQAFMSPVKRGLPLPRNWFRRPVTFIAPRRDTQVVMVSAMAVVLVAGLVIAAFPRESPLPVTKPNLVAAGSQDGLTPIQQALQVAVGATSFPALSPTFDQILGDKATEMLPATGCLNPDNLNDTRRCTYGPPAAERTAMVIGDSIAASWMPTVRAILVPRGYRVSAVALTNCPFAMVDIRIDNDVKSTKRCKNTKDQIYDRVNRERPDLVVVSSSAAALTAVATRAQGAVLRSQWREGTVKALQRIRPSGARVVILSPNPVGPAAAACVTTTSTPRDCETRLSELWRIKASAERAAAETAQATYVDTQDLFCFRGICPIFAAGTPIRWDEQHLTRTYGLQIAPLLAPELLPDSSVGSK